jgi:nicotinamidase-related amidase
MNIPAPLVIENTVLVVIDFQQRLFPVIHEKETLLRNALKLIQGIKVLDIPIILTEQYPRGLGPTIPEMKELLRDVKPLEKVCFGCYSNEGFKQSLEATRRKQVLITGIETHICVYQTAMELARAGYEVQVAADCVSSRDPYNKKIALRRLGAAGINPTTAEMALFELLKVATSDKFKQISGIVK